MAHEIFGEVELVERETNMSVSIQVGMRCRPFVCDDELGVMMRQNSEIEGEVNLLRSKYSTNRFAFSWSWWRCVTNGDDVCCAWFSYSVLVSFFPRALGSCRFPPRPGRGSNFHISLLILV